MKTYSEIKQELYGRVFDLDGAYGGQCWDGYAKYCQLLGYPFAYCTNSGYVKDIYELKESNGMLKNFTLVRVMQPGDIAVFKESASCPLSHIAIFDHDAGGGYGWFLGQNQNGVSQFTITKLPYADTYDYAFRPNCYLNGSESVGKRVESGELIDQILHVGSYVTSKAMKIGNQGLKDINGDTCCYLAELGGWFPIRFVSEADASDGKKDNYLATTNAKVTVDRCRVESVNKYTNCVVIHGITVHAEPLIEIE